MGIGKTHATLGQTIDVWRLYLGVSIVTGKIPIAHVVHQ
jgi:hypothetical protein